MSQQCPGNKKATFIWVYSKPFCKLVVCVHEKTRKTILVSLFIFQNSIFYWSLLIMNRNHKAYGRKKENSATLPEKNFGYCYIKQKNDILMLFKFEWNRKETPCHTSVKILRWHHAWIKSEPVGIYQSRIHFETTGSLF
jgi:hypothetical protein